MAEQAPLRPQLPILFGAAIMLSISMGIRQSFGLFMQPVTAGIALTVSDFTLALAVQNLAWGLLQPVAGALAARYRFRPILLSGAVLYIAGLAVLAAAHGLPGVVLGAGILIGASLACTASAMALAVSARAVPPDIRSLVLGLITGAGSLGALASAPLAQSITAAHGWRVGVLALLVLALGLIPSAWFASRADRIAVPTAPGSDIGEVNATSALCTALGRGSFLIMTGSYFVCGMQLLFITTHLPSYLEICGMDPMLSAEALGLVGIFNVFGSVFFGWAGGRWSKRLLLGLIYTTRSLVLGWYFISPPTPASTLLFASMMGFLWLGVGPLIAGSVVEMFGLRWQAMVQGLAFMSHQLGSFLGAYGGGVLYDALGSYDLAWRIGVGLGLLAGAVQIISALAVRDVAAAPAATRAVGAR